MRKTRNAYTVLVGKPEEIWALVESSRTLKEYVTDKLA
jgi:hypothetical protein